MTLYKIVNGVYVELDEFEANDLIRTQEDHARFVAQIKYLDERRAAYPTIGDQLDAIWKYLGAKDLDGEAKLCYNKVKDVKLKYPKPE